ncbi:hypothetical protein COLO4_33208 [Corchorus olitorius]|uniref:Uncharacterized protein n=1 Tax=Corchorus olitorius TaxID=93759 RepID=A0A1R3GVJ9_9ROSI|nr:hypothetical protein COLO4_33208 [Corchorus olitorius]
MKNTNSSNFVRSGEILAGIDERAESPVETT